MYIISIVVDHMHGSHKAWQKLCVLGAGHAHCSSTWQSLSFGSSAKISGPHASCCLWCSGWNSWSQWWSQSQQAPPQSQSLHSCTKHTGANCFCTLRLACSVECMPMTNSRAISSNSSVQCQSLCVCVCVCVCVWVYTTRNTHAHMHTHTCTHAHTQTPWRGLSEALGIFIYIDSNIVILWSHPRHGKVSALGIWITPAFHTSGAVINFWQNAVIWTVISSEITTPQAWWSLMMQQD